MCITLPIYDSPRAPNIPYPLIPHTHTTPTYFPTHRRLADEKGLCRAHLARTPLAPAQPQPSPRTRRCRERLTKKVLPGPSCTNTLGTLFIPRSPHHQARKEGRDRARAKGLCRAHLDVGSYFAITYCTPCQARTDLSCATRFDSCSPIFAPCAGATTAAWPLELALH